jgi:hypothetical protein
MDKEYYIFLDCKLAGLYKATANEFCRLDVPRRCRWRRRTWATAPLFQREANAHCLRAQPQGDLGAQHHVDQREEPRLCIAASTNRPAKSLLPATLIRTVALIHKLFFSIFK